MSTQMQKSSSIIIGVPEQDEKKGVARNKFSESETETPSRKEKTRGQTKKSMITKAKGLV